MSDAPYRPDPSASEEDAELARMAAQGQHRILESSERDASLKQRATERTRERNVRIALGGYYGTPPPWIAAYVLMGAGIVMATGIAANVVGRVVRLPGSISTVGMVAVFAGIFLRVFVPPTASRRRLVAEQAWAKALPFLLEGYFETLAADPELACRLDVTVAWKDAASAPAPDMVMGIVGLLDAGARVESNGERVTVRSSPICGWTGSSQNTRPVMRNDRIVRYVHKLVPGALLPLHQRHPIGGVSLTRVECTYEEQRDARPWKFPWDRG